jgi:cullin-4
VMVTCNYPLGGLNKGETMVREISHSQELTERFKQFCQNELKNNTTKKNSDSSLEAKNENTETAMVDCNVKILSAFLWNFQPRPLVPPPEFLAFQEKFCKFYAVETQKAKTLKWIYKLSSCVIVAQFKKRRHELLLTLQQAAIILLFNRTSQLTCPDIAHQTQLRNEEVEEIVSFLIKQKILKANETGPTREIGVNEKFTSKRFRIKLNGKQAQPSKKAADKVTEAAIQNRRPVIQAGVVRIMKTHRILSHVDLINQVVQQLNFPCQIKLIKGEIEHLVMREYIKREGSNYVYIP